LSQQTFEPILRNLLCAGWIEIKGWSERTRGNFEPLVNQKVFDRVQRDKLNEEIVLAEMQEREAKLETYDVEAVLNFAQHIILNAAQLWTKLESDAKQRLQKVLFPQGVAFAKGSYKTAETCLLFKLLQESESKKNWFGDPTGNRTRATSVKGRCPNR
jgi:hypothetical protein